MRPAALSRARWARNLAFVFSVGVVGCGTSTKHTDPEPEPSPEASVVELSPFSFFVTSLRAMQKLSGSQAGFGGDLTFGKSDGLSGADEICRQIADGSMPGAGQKTWRAFLSVTAGEDGAPVHAIDRIGQGPWYDRLGRVVAMTLEELAKPRPGGADPAIANDLPNEEGLPNHAPDGLEPVDNHDILTGSDKEGHLFGTDWGPTCHDWTSAEGAAGRPRVGHSWPRDFGDFFNGSIPLPTRVDGGGGFPFDPSVIDFKDFDPIHWMSSLDEAGCAPGVGIVEMGPPNPKNPTVGSGGGYGGIYCFSTTP